MKIRIACSYLFGSEKAIHKVAKNPSSIPTGIILVLTAAIARNYDQIFIGEHPVRWLLGSLLFSYISAVFLFSLAFYGFARRELKKTGRESNFIRGFPSFLALFWMSAPIAWLYAIPFERFFDPISAAKANVALLAIVSLWRVLLMARALAVLLNAAFLKMLMWVLAPASVEAFVLAALNENLAKRIMAAMSGIRNAPDAEVLMNAIGTVITVSPIVFLIALVAALCMRSRKQIQPFPNPAFSHKPSWWSLTLLVLWAGLAVAPQRELFRNHRVAVLISKEQYSQALDYLSAHDPSDFAPAKRIAPDPYEPNIREHLPSLLHAMDGSEKPWVRQMYLDYFLILLKHRMYLGYQAEPVAEAIEALTNIPEAQLWIERNKEEIRPALQEAYRLLKSEGFKDLDVFLKAMQSLAL